MNKFDFKGKTAVVTGGAQGFGLDIAKRFLDGGAKVFIWDIDEKLLKSVFDEILKPEGLLSRDSRNVERKKYGRKKARKKFQFSKR